MDDERFLIDIFQEVFDNILESLEVEYGTKSQ